MRSSFTARTFLTVEEAIKRAHWRIERSPKPLTVKETDDGRFYVDYGSGGVVDIHAAGFFSRPTHTVRHLQLSETSLAG